jgi:hypothetical protein
MCPPIVLAGLSLAVGTLGAVTSYRANQQQAALQTQQSEQNAENSVDALRQEYSQLQLRQLQEGDKAVAESHRMRIEEAQAKSRARLSAAEAGVTGISVDSLVADIGAQADLEEEARRYNYNATIEQLHQEQLSAKARAEGRILSVPRGVKPSPMTLVAGIGGAAVDAFRLYRTPSNGTV